VAIANLFNLPTVPRELEDWTFVHMVHHRDVNEQIFLLTGIRLDEFVLDPLNPNDPGQWEYQHQAMHQAVNSVLGISGFDLSDVDFLHTDKLAGFILQNATEHRQWADILGVD
jgi:hypothetical protein